MTNKITILFVLLCSQLVCGQKSNSEELVDLMHWLKTHLESSKDSIELNSKSIKAIKLSKQLNNQATLVQSYRYLAMYHKEYSKLDSSDYYFHRVENLYIENNDQKNLAYTYLDLKALWAVRADYNKAKNYVYKALKIFETLNNREGIALCYSHIGDLLYYENDYNEATRYCEKAIEIQKQIGRTKELATSYCYKAKSELFTGFDLDNALSSVNTSIAIYKELGETGIPLMASINWRGNIYKYMERYDEAIADYQSNFNNSKAMGLERYLIPSLGNIGHVYIMQGKYEDALPYSLQAIDLIKKTGRTRNLWENYMHTAEIYESLGDTKMALYYHQLYAAELESFKDNIILSLENEAQSKYEIGKKNATILFQTDKINQQKRTKILYAILTVLLSFILFGLLYYFRKRQKQNKELNALNNKLDAKNKQNELLLKEIHHRVKNNLEMVKSLIALQSAQLEDSETKDAMLASQNRVQSMGIIHQKLYQGEDLGSIEMKDYFVNLSEGILDTFNAEEKVKIECIMEDLNLDIDTAVPIGLIVNELLTNALKYAFPEDQKGQIKISLEKSLDNHQLRLKVADNGIGKTMGALPKGTGFGTQLVDLLTKQLNGKMTEQMDKGTLIEFEFLIDTAA